MEMCVAHKQKARKRRNFMFFYKKHAPMCTIKLQRFPFNPIEGRVRINNILWHLKQHGRKIVNRHGQSRPY